MERLEGRKHLRNELNWHEVMGVERLVKVIKSLSKEVIEATNRRVGAWRRTHNEKKGKIKESGVVGKLMEIDGFI